MVLMLVERQCRLDEVVFFDTGMEFRAIYGIRDQLLPTLYDNGIKYTELQPRTTLLYNMLERQYESKKTGKKIGYGWCGGMCRWGTAEKRMAIDKYAREKNATTVYVGIAADEPRRLKNTKPHITHPLAEWGIGEAECLSYCYAQGYEWSECGIRLYDVLDRVSCWCCRNKNRKELRNIYRYLPEYWERLKELQSKIDAPMKHFHNRVYGDYGNVFDLEKVFERELR